MDGCIQSDEGGGKIRLVSGYKLGVLIGDYPAVSTGITVALVAPADACSPALSLFDPLAPCIQADVASVGC